MRQSSSVPFPVAFESNEDLRWSKNQKGRICVEFNGLSEHTFEVYCDKRQLHWFQRFLEDQQIKRDSKNQHSSSLFTVRSGRLAWQQGEGKGDPWNVHRHWWIESKSYRPLFEALFRCRDSKVLQ